MSPSNAYLSEAVDEAETTSTLVGFCSHLSISHDHPSSCGQGVGSSFSGFRLANQKDKMPACSNAVRNGL